MTPAARRAIAAATLAALVGGCGPNHIGPFTPRQRRYKPGAYAQASPDGRPTTGSLFSDSRGGLLEDTRAVRVGDTVVVRIDESSDAKGGASTNLSRENKGLIGFDAMLGLVPTIRREHPDIDPSQLLEFLSKGDFKGSGDTARHGALSGSIAVRVKQSMPNGDLYLEGTKVLLINNEEYHLYISGLVRPADILNDNTVPSSRIADAQIEFTGSGDLADQQRKGWLSRAIDTVNPL